MTDEKKKILIVEDDQSLSKALHDKLSHEGFSILEAKNGEEGLDLSLKKHPDLILLDIIMPRMDGETMIKKLRQDDWGRSAKIIILTNLSSDEVANEAMKKDVFLYLIKSDTRIDEVIAKIKEVI